MLKKKFGKKLSIALASSIVVIAGGIAVFASVNPNFFQSNANQDLAANVEDVIETESYTETTVEEVTEEITTQELETESYVEETTTATVAAVTEEATTQPTEALTEETTSEVLSGDAAYAAQAKANASTYSSYINEVYSLINDLRASQGLGAVSLDQTITLAACHRAYENAVNNFFVVDSTTGHHMRPNGSKASTIASYYGLAGSFGEVMGRYQTSPSGIVDGWIGSPSHYNVLVSSKYTRVGVGVAQDSEGNYYWVAIFMN
ncbi:MAG: CAP domain-containing protein [Lachnospira sp.]|uniref:Uncharacterized conserved protein YkwD, contains CAP (CSP/antigen 5/PR1) domain n=1 Tax=Lachnospira pectinoschiza TaxID=28052 RepID=A0A1G9WU79_9FIRM|nr:CAP domain-containing protein [Lachnospira pectinoschiza]MCR5516741.1 CAP domain-containing protein [Lachnospira sp.]SDM88028.1 Uncharacterized conserved protein YkwD, contains CAP (CSP/antigen 5/PR1) domain [Lachnospira pectinoschiza]